MVPEQGQTRQTGDPISDPNVNCELKRVLYEATVQLATAEAQLIWGRYYSMLTANSVIAVVFAGVLAVSPRNLMTVIVIGAIAVFGISLCYQWLRMTEKAWKLSNLWVEHAKQFQWDRYKNPMTLHSDWKSGLKQGKKQHDEIYEHATRVIWLFICGYGVGAVAAVIVGIAALWCEGVWAV